MSHTTEAAETVVREFYTTAEAAPRLGVTRSLIYRMVERGELPCKYAGARVLIPIDAYERWLREGAA